MFKSIRKSLSNSPIPEIPISQNNEPFLFYKSSNSPQSINKKSKNKSSDFLKRNYKIKKKSNTIKMINKLELNDLLYRLKNYYDVIEMENERLIKRINEIRNQNKLIENKIENVEKGKEIESESDRISGLEKVNNVNEVINTIKNLDLKSKNGKNEVVNEDEYSLTLKCLIEDSKNQIVRIKEETCIIEQKLHDLKFVKKDLENNKLKRKDNLFRFKTINNVLERQLGIIHNIMIEQEYKKTETERKNLKIENELNQLKERYNKDKEIALFKLNQYKEEQLDKINVFKYQKDKKIQNEKEIINFIIGVYFFQKYFINKEKEKKNLDEIINNQYKSDSDFLNFMKGQQYILSNSDDENLIDNNLNTDINTILKKSKSNNLIKFNSLEYNKENMKTEKKTITLNEIITKFNYIDLKYDEVYDFYTKIISLANFRRKKMIELNKKIINLETKKQNYIKKVNLIINNDIKNMNSLIEKNIKFKQFIQNNKYEINKANKKREEIISKTIMEVYKENSHPDGNLIKKRNAFIEKCIKAKIQIILIYESLIESMNTLNNFKFYEDNNKNLKEKISDKIINLTKKFVNEYKEINRIKYIKDILEYSKNKKIQFSEIIYNILFNGKNEKNLKMFIKDNLIDETFMFYFFKIFNNQIELSKLIKKISIFYYNIYNDQNNYDKLGNFNRSTIRNLTNKAIDSVKTKNNKKKTILFTKSKENEQIKKENNSNTINDEYNYEKTTDDSEDYNQINKRIRPKTSRIPISKRIVKQLYEPSLKKSQYLRQLKSTYNIMNSDFNIRRSNRKFLNRKWSEIRDLDNQFYIYNNKSKILFFIFY